MTTKPQFEDVQTGDKIHVVYSKEGFHNFILITRAIRVSKDRIEVHGPPTLLSLRLKEDGSWESDYGATAVLWERVPDDSWMRAKVIKAKRIQPPGIPTDHRPVFMVRSVDGDFVDEGAGVWTLDMLTGVTVIVDERGRVMA